MKKGLILLSVILPVCLLGSCVENNSSSATPTGWSEAETAFMDKYLGGNYIPFYYVAGQVLTDSYYADSGCLSVEADVGIEDNLKSYETILVAAGYDAVVAYGSDTTYPYLIDYSIDCADKYVLEVQAYIGDGKTNSGKWTIDAYYKQTFDDYSAEYTTYADAKAGVISYFTNYEVSNAVLPESITSSATSFTFSDYRYLYSSVFGVDVGPYALLSLNEALETELSDVIAAFTAIGFEVKTSTDSDGATSTYYEKDGFDADISYYAYDPDSPDYPASIDIMLYPAE